MARGGRLLLLHPITLTPTMLLWYIIYCTEIQEARLHCGCILSCTRIHYASQLLTFWMLQASYGPQVYNCLNLILRNRVSKICSSIDYLKMLRSVKFRVSAWVRTCRWNATARNITYSLFTLATTCGAYRFCSLCVHVVGMQRGLIITNMLHYWVTFFFFIINHWPFLFFSL